MTLYFEKIIKRQQKARLCAKQQIYLHLIWYSIYEPAAGEISIFRWPVRKATKAVAELFASNSCTTPKLKWIFVTLCPPPLRFDQSHKMQSLFYCLPFLVGVTEVNLYINKFLKNAIMCSEMLNNLQASYVSYSWGFVTAIAAHSKIRNSFSASSFTKSR